MENEVSRILLDYSCMFCLGPQVLSNIDELFEREELSAAPDPGWPDCFNSGVFVFKPSNETYNKLLALCTETGSFDGEWCHTVLLLLLSHTFSLAAASITATF